MLLHARCLLRTFEEAGYIQFRAAFVILIDMDDAYFINWKPTAARYMHLKCQIGNVLRLDIAGAFDLIKSKTSRRLPLQNVYARMKPIIQNSGLENGGEGLCSQVGPAFSRPKDRAPKVLLPQRLRLERACVRAVQRQCPRAWLASLRALRRGWVRGVGARAAADTGGPLDNRFW